MEENKNITTEQPAENTLNKIIPAEETAVPETGEVSFEQPSTFNTQPSTLIALLFLNKRKDY